MRALPRDVGNMHDRVLKPAAIESLATRARHQRTGQLRRQPLAPFPHRIFALGPGFLIAPGLEVGFAAPGKDIPPRCFKCRAGGLETGGSPVSLVAGIAARIKAAMPLPRLGPVRDARSLNDHADADAGIVDVPAFGLIIDAFAGEGGDAAIEARPKPAGNKRANSRTKNEPSCCVRVAETDRD
jgi:hypothetical protein